MKELTNNEMLYVNGGKISFKDIVSYGQAIYDTATGIWEGFRDTVKELPR